MGLPRGFEKHTLRSTVLKGDIAALERRHPWPPPFYQQGEEKPVRPKDQTCCYKLHTRVFPSLLE